MAGLGLKNEPRSKRGADTEAEPLRNRPRSAGQVESTKGSVSLSDVVRRLSNPQLLRGISLFLLLVAIYLLVAMVSYLFTWQNDQDLVNKYGGGILWAKDVVVENNLGRLGAYLAHLLVYEGFGVASLALLFYVIQLSFWLGLTRS